MHNSEISEILSEIATLLELKNENVFKIRSYQKAALNIERLTEPLTEIYETGGREALQKIEGIGTGLAEKIEEIIKNGKSSYLNELKKDIPKGLLEIIKLQGVGPKLAKRFYDELNIKTIDELKKAAIEGKLKKLSGFQEKKIQNIIQAIENFDRLDKKHLIAEILPYTEEIISLLKDKTKTDKIHYCGSLRRKKETIGDIDILAIADNNPQKIIDTFLNLPHIEKILAKGKTKVSVLLKIGLNADLRVVSSDCFGSALHYFTGSKEHNIAIRKLAISKGLKVSEYGVFKKNKKIAGQTEEEVFESLGLKFIPPELREDLGEIEAAQTNNLPKLIEQSDLKGDLHMHSDYTDGAVSIKEMAIAAKKLGYEYIAITDHSKSTTIANGLDEKRLEQQIKEIEKVNNELSGIRVLKGIEVDILKDGSLDLNDDILSKLDFVIASVHSNFNMSKVDMTNRIIKAMQNKYVTVIGHPTGRLIGKRLPYDIDLHKIFEMANKTNTFLELNSFPDRLDLNDINCKYAKGKNVLISIGTDAHSVHDLSFIRYGIGTARRGWLEKKNVLNSFTLKELLSKINIKRQKY